jgi:hypothetical protein
MKYEYSMATGRKATYYVSYVISVPSRARSVPSKACSQKRQHAAHKRLVAPHSADTETSSRQFPCQIVQAQICVIVFSTSTRTMEMNYFLTHLTTGFKIGPFVYVSNIKTLFSFDVGNIYIHNNLVTHRIESSSKKSDIHTTKHFSCCQVVEWHPNLHVHCFC